MSSLIEGAKKLVSPGPDLGARVSGLEQALDAARGRLDDTLLDDVTTVVERSAGRLKLSAQHTVVALAGATGSGKSSTFNALTDLELSSVGVRRPTTSWTTACVWGSEGAGELLEWLGIPARHQVTRDSMLSTGREDKALAGTVLLDLPDHDSTEVSHHLEMDRLVHLADLLVWVLDPQKYADAAIHDRYLSQLTEHQDVMVVVLNQIDRIPEDRREAMLADVRRLLDADGLERVPVIGVSAKQGWGIDELKGQIRSRVDAKKATRIRMEADLRAAADRIAEVSGDAATPKVSKERARALQDALAEAAGVPTVVKAVEDATRMRANRATGWPVVSWFSKFRPDPLKRLHLDLDDRGRELVRTPRTSVPEATGVQRARLDAEVRALADDVSTGLTPPWTRAVRAASVARLDEAGDRLDKSLGATDLGVARIPVWASLVRVLQWLLLVAAVVGGVWLLGLAVGEYLRLPELPTPKLGAVAVPTVLLLGGIGWGILLAVVCRVLVGATASSRARTADKRLRRGLDEVAEELVLEPVRAELAAYGQVREGLKAARA